MAKERTTISIQGDVLKKAKENRLNISRITEDEIRRKINPTIKDIPEENIKFKCSLCSEIVDYGYFCEARDMFLCEKCQDGFNMSKCPHDKRGEHFHIRIPGYEGNNKELVKNLNKKHISGAELAVLA